MIRFKLKLKKVLASKAKKHNGVLNNLRCVCYYYYNKNETRKQIIKNHNHEFNLYHLSNFRGEITTTNHRKNISLIQILILFLFYNFVHYI